MFTVALTVVAATAAGTVADHRAGWAPVVARRCLAGMLYCLIPFVSYVGFARLQLTLGAGAGLLLAYVGLALAGALVWTAGRRLGLARPELGALICTVILANTGYLGLPTSLALLGPAALSHAIAYDQLISGPMVFTAGFAVGAAFGAAGSSEPGLRARARAFLLRNPPLWGAAAGLLTGWAPAPLPAISHDVLAVMLVMGFFAVGVYLSSERREDHAPLFERPDRRVGLALVCRLLVNPAWLLLVSLAGVGIPGAYLLQAAMPSGINGLIVGHAYGLDQRLIATVIVWSTSLVVAVAVLSRLL